MNKFFLYLVLPLFLSNCGLGKKDVVENNPNAKVLFEKSKPIEQELNTNLNIKISTITKGEPFLSSTTNNNGNLNIELKPNKNFEKENVYQIYKITKNINQIDIFFSSFDIISILEISKLYPQSIRSFLLDDFKEYNIDDLISISINHDLKICGLNIDLVTADIIKKIKQFNMAITVYSDKNINLSRAKDIFSIGVDSIFVDNPLELLGKF